MKFEILDWDIYPKKRKIWENLIGRRGICVGEKIQNYVFRSVFDAKLKTREYKVFGFLRN